MTDVTLADDCDEIHAMFDCVDCGINTCDTDEYYMVHDHLWTSVGMAPDGGMLCIGCLEQRLSRKLTAADFSAAPINHANWNLHSARLNERLNTHTH